MDRDVFEHLRFDTPATLLCAIEQDGMAPEDLPKLFDRLAA